MSSSRLPGKSNLKLKGMTVLNWVINTGKSIEGVDKVILATSKDKDCDCLEELANKENIFCIRGSEENVLSRYTDAIKKFNLDYVIRITGDDTCQDPDFISIALKQFFDQDCDYLISSTENYPLIDGLIFEIFKSSLLLDVSTQKDLSSKEKEHVTTHIRDKKIKYKQGFLNIVNIPKIYINKFNFKLCVDNYNDFKNLEESWSTKSSNKNLNIANTEEIILNITRKYYSD